MDFKKELMTTFRARIPVVNVVSHEENRIIADMLKMTEMPEWPKECGLYSWDMADQFVCHRPAAQAYDVGKQASVDTLLNLLDKYKGSAVFVLKDFHQVWQAKSTVGRKLRNLCARLGKLPGWKNLVMITPEQVLPVELKEDVPCLYYPKPDAGAMDGILEEVVGSGAFGGAHDQLREKIVTTALGLSGIQGRRVFQKAIVSTRDGRLNESCIDLITEEKRQIIRESGALELYPHTEDYGDVGGLEVLKGWLKTREVVFSNPEDAMAYGLAPLRGLALIGIPGTGKSLCAKMTARLWNLPLLRMDMGAVFGGIVGSSEKNVREAIAISEVIAPCILWVDEIEKAFSASAGDSGTSSRVLATFLTWMQEKKNPVFVFATANDMKRLPLELLRKGRFDEVFFLDLPTPEERRAILEVHLRKKGYTMISQRFRMDDLAEATEGFVGAEMEAVVNDAMFPAFMDQQRELETEDLLKSTGEMVPMAVSHKNVIEELRKYVAHGDARNASVQDQDDEVKLDHIRRERADKGRFMEI